MIEREVHAAIWRARFQRTLAWALAIATGGAAAWRIARWAGVTPLLPSAVAAITLLVVAARLFRSRPISTAAILEHFNRSLPQLEESAALLHAGAADASPLERLQRMRVETAWQGMTARPSLPLPSVRTALLIAAGAFLLGLIVPAIPPLAPAAPALRNTTDAKAAALTVGQVAVRWSPPRYTGLSAREAITLDATVEAGSAVTWRVTPAGASAVRIISAAGDTLNATRQGTAWQATEVLQAGLVWHVEVGNGDGQWVRGEEHLLRVLLDREPVVAVVAPAGRIELEWQEPHLVVVRAVARDDYGLASIRLAATVAKGRGEGVKFKENWLAVEIESRASSKELVASRRVNLDSLGVEPGDEVFLAFEAVDNRAPAPQRARSETIFLSLLDTLSGGTASFEGLAVRVEPAYFRSQRQIILDTEALLRDVREGRVTDGGFARSLEIGMDQHLLRLRYGAMVGEENSEAEAPDQDLSGRHDHDMVDNATLLSPAVKELLKAALAAMWDAERDLRTGRAKPALPAEYRALAALEEVRRAERSYVKRIGFEPKPIDVARTRLTRKADRLGPLVVADTLATLVTEPLLRDALVALDGPRDESAKASLDAAARRLAQRALEGEPARHLETLRALRRLIDGECIECVSAARRGLLAALPPASRPVRPVRGAAGSLGNSAP